MRIDHEAQGRPRAGLVPDLAASLALLLILLGAPALAPGAHATTGEVSYGCTAPAGDETLVVTLDTAAPERMFVGDSVAATATAVLPGNLGQHFRESLGAASFSGTVVVAHAEGGGARTLTLSIADTALGDQAEPRPVPFAASGTYTATTPGRQVLAVSGFTATFTLRGADGTSRLLDVQCRPGTGSVPVIDTVSVVARSVTTLGVDRVVSRHGEAVTATALVTTSGGSPVGDVAFSLDGVATKVAVAADGTASWRLPTAPAGVHTLAATFVPDDLVFHRSSTSAPVALAVARATTRTRVAVTGRRSDRRTSARLRVLAENGTTATGRVRVVLRQLGTGRRWVRSRALAGAGRTVGLGRLARGRYRLVVRYSGDDDHLRGPKVVRSFRVRRG